MTAPVKSNFGHIKESGVLLLTKEDSDAKHARNVLLTTTAVSTLFTLGIGALWVVSESEREIRIRDLNRKHFKELPYSKCVQLEKYGSVVFNDLFYDAWKENGVMKYSRRSDPNRLTALRAQQARTEEKRAREAELKQQEDDAKPFHFEENDCHWDLSDIK